MLFDLPPSEWPNFYFRNGHEGETGSYGEACTLLLERMDETAALAKAGAMLGNWLRLGLIAGIAAA